MNDECTLCGVEVDLDKPIHRDRFGLIICETCAIIEMEEEITQALDEYEDES